jgi:hypothetical protein
MRIPTNGVLVLSGLALTATLLASIGAPSARKPPVALATSTPEPASVAAHGFALTSASIELPDDTGTYPDGPPHADRINANCTACHSASMALAQPPMSADQWTAEVTKMQEVYKAPVAKADVPRIVDYLVHMPSQHASAPTGRAQDPDPKGAPDVSGATG